MIRPTLGALVGGISRGLRADVLAQLPPGGAQRQLKAALHALDRIGQCWDLVSPALIEDNIDIAASVTKIVAGVERQGLKIPPDIQRMLDALPADASARHMNTNEALQHILVALDPWLRKNDRSGLNDLNNLYRRMVARELKVIADEEISPGEIAMALETAGAAGNPEHTP